MREEPGITWNFPRGETRLIVWNEDWDVNMKMALKNWRLNQCIFFYRFLFKDSYQRLYASQRNPEEKLYPSWKSMYLTLCHFGLSCCFSKVKKGDRPQWVLSNGNVPLRSGLDILRASAGKVISFAAPLNPMDPDPDIRPSAKEIAPRR